MKKRAQQFGGLIWSRYFFLHHAAFTWVNIFPANQPQQLALVSCVSGQQAVHLADLVWSESQVNSRYLFRSKQTKQQEQQNMYTRTRFFVIQHLKNQELRDFDGRSRERD